MRIILEALVQLLSQPLQVVGIMHIYVHADGHSDVSRQQVADVLHHRLIGIHTFIYKGLHTVVGLLRAVDGDLNVFQVPQVVRLLYRLGIQQKTVAGHRRAILDASLLQPVRDVVDNGLVEEWFTTKPPDADLLAATVLDDVFGHLLCRLLRHRSAGLPQLVAVEAAGVAAQGRKDRIDAFHNRSHHIHQSERKIKELCGLSRFSTEQFKKL